MKKINLVNIILLLIMSFIYIYDHNSSSKNLKSLEKTFLNNYNNLNYKNLIDENRNLNNLLNLKPTNLDVIVTKGRFINSYEEFIINKGKNDGFKAGFAVMNQHRLIGFIKNTHDNYSNVELLENLSKKISVKVNENYGFLEVKNNKLIITGIKGENMRINDEVYTSGLTEIPGNIYIGKIREIKEKDEIFETEAYLLIEKKYNTYKYLLVVK